MSMDATIRAMIAEQGDMWADAVAERHERYQAVVIADGPSRCWRLTRNIGDTEWTIEEDKLDENELASFFAAFGSHWKLLLGAQVGDAHYPVRAFIKNGRKKTQGWSISIETPASIP